MAISDYELQVVRRGTHQVVARWPPGLEQERDLVDAIVSGLRDDHLVERIVGAVQAKGVGLLKTETHVLAAVRDACAAHTPLTAQDAAVRAAIESALYEVKAQVQP